MSGAILCVGALAMDTIFRLDALPLAAGKYIPLEAVEVAEGMASAQAAAIVRLGGTARLWASVGDDATGERLRAQLAEAGVDCAAIRIVPGARSGFSSIFMDRRGERIIVPRYDAGLASAPDALPAMDGIAVVSTDVRWPMAAEAALRAARERGIPGLLDLDVGPSDVLEGLLPLASHVIASEPAAALLTGCSDPAEALVALATRHPGFFAVTAGDQGCHWYDRAAGRPRHVPAPKVEAIDTLAAGDVFHGAFALGLAEGWETERNLRFASVAAAIKCSRFGGRLGTPTRHEVEALLED